MQSHFRKHYKIISKIVKFSFKKFNIFLSKDKFIKLLSLTNKEYDNILIKYNPSFFYIIDNYCNYNFFVVK